MDISNIEGLAIKKIDNNPDKPTIIFLHDSLGCIELWRYFPEKLGKLTGCNVLIYDRQGYGKSKAFSNPKRNNDYMEIEADILEELLEKQNINKAILFGHSDGGSVALIAGAKYPSKILGIITEGAHVFVEVVTLKGINEAIDLYKTTNLKSKLEKYHGDKTEAMFWAWAKTWNTEQFKDWNIEKFLPSIQCPILVIQGENDEYGTLKQVDSIVTKSSGINKKLIIPDTKHTPHKEAEEIVIKNVIDFVNSLIV